MAVHTHRWEKMVMAVDFKSIGRFEQGALIAGGLSLILSFINKYVTVSFDGDDVPGLSGAVGGTNAWDSWATIGILLVIVATAIVAVKAFARENLPAGVPWSLAAFAAAALGTLLLILRAFTYSDGGVAQVSIGPGWSGWALFITTIALSVLTFLSFRESGEKIPEFNKGGATTTSTSGPTPPAAPPAAPPAPPAAGPPVPPTTPPAPPAPPASGPPAPPTA